MTELKPCPFCGSDCVNDTTPPEGSAEGSYFWVCPCCVSCGPVGASVNEATELWNKRPHENKAKAQAVRETTNSVLGCAGTKESGIYYGQFMEHANKLEKGN